MTILEILEKARKEKEIFSSFELRFMTDLYPRFKNDPQFTISLSQLDIFKIIESKLHAQEAKQKKRERGCGQCHNYAWQPWYDTLEEKILARRCECSGGPTWLMERLIKKGDYQTAEKIKMWEAVLRDASQTRYERVEQSL